MRMIDADALLKAINELPVLCHDPGWVKAAVLLTIDNMPTIQPDAPRVMTPEEVWSLHEGSVAWFEERDDGGRTYIQPMMSNGKAFMIGTHLDINVSRGSLNWSNRRFWTSRPTDEQREKEPWNG